MLPGECFPLSKQNLQRTPWVERCLSVSLLYLGDQPFTPMVHVETAPLAYTTPLPINMGLRLGCTTTFPITILNKSRFATNSGRVPLRKMHAQKEKLVVKKIQSVSALFTTTVYPRVVRAAQELRLLLNSPGKESRK